jgi:hypothetical protein
MLALLHEALTELLDLATVLWLAGPFLDLLGELENDRLAVRIHTHAQSSLVRGAIENGARAVWLLGPATRLIRVKRACRWKRWKYTTPTGSASSQGHRGGARRTSGCSSCGS